jgi:hypothetical protein
VVYERLPRTISHHTVKLGDTDHFNSTEDSIILILRHTPTSILCVSRTVYKEALPYVHATMQDFVLRAPPRIILPRSCNAEVIYGALLFCAAVVCSSPVQIALPPSWLVLRSALRMF